MAIAHAQEFLSINPGSTADPFDISCAASATPNGVVVVIEQNGAVTDQIASVVYGTGAGSVTLTRRRFDTESTEAGGIYIYWAGGSNVFPSGTQTLRIDRSAVTSNMGAVVSLMTVAAGKVVAFDSEGTGLSASVANPSWTHTSLTNDVVAYLGIHSGLLSMTATPATNWVLQGSFDIGAQGRGFARRTLAAAGALAPGWTASTADDFVGSSIAFREADPPVSMPDPIHAAVAGRITNPGREAPQYL
jgi:hypothetical protein